MPEQKSPLVSTVEHTYKRLISYHVAVWFVVVVALILQTVLGLEYLLYGIGQIALAVLFSMSLIASKLIFKKQALSHYPNYMDAITKALLASLLLPTQSPFFIIIITIILIIVVEYVFKLLFRKNIIHPVLLSVLVVQLLFRDFLPISETMINIFQEETLPVGPIRLLIGGYEGVTLGTSAFLVLGLLWIYLSVTKIIQIKMSLWYALNMIIGMFVIALFTEYSLTYTFINLILGYTLLVLVFFVAEPTSTPETDELMIVYPFVAVLLTMWFRISFNIVEAALYAIVFAQFITWIIEQFQNRTNLYRIKALYGLTVFTWLLIIIQLVIR